MARRPGCDSGALQRPARHPHYHGLAAHGSGADLKPAVRRADGPDPIQSRPRKPYSSQ
ncbi:hypothetical protein SAMN05216289_105134 [Dokdonella immobilis]|uniref:Uncharacterized protein n=1 Tax=Dokdonella immobilis TaxID=578942 RepID=A0A1I4WME6_9GAMM|nr:hypothetical protein SAMN05216289_105134 [Dokdonella immobilis]